MLYRSPTHSHMIKTLLLIVIGKTLDNTLIPHEWVKSYFPLIILIFKTWYSSAKKLNGKVLLIIGSLIPFDGQPNRIYETFLNQCHIYLPMSMSWCFMLCRQSTWYLFPSPVGQTMHKWQLGQQHPWYTSPLGQRGIWTQVPHVPPISKVIMLTTRPLLLYMCNICILSYI